MPALIFYLVACIATLWSWTKPSEIFHATQELVFNQHQYWRLVTSLFLHADTAHLIGNFIFFSIFGTLLFQYFGKISFPIASIIGGILTNVIVLKMMEPNQGLLGASGIVYFMFAVWIGLYIPLERRHSLNQRIFRALGFFLIQFVPHTYDPSVSYMSHFVGLGIGFVYAFGYFLINRHKLYSEEVWQETVIEPANETSSLPFRPPQDQ